MDSCFPTVMSLLVSLLDSGAWCMLFLVETPCIKTNAFLSFLKSLEFSSCGDMKWQFGQSALFKSLYKGTVQPYFYTPGIYAEGYIVFVFPFVCSFVIPYLSWNYLKVLPLSNSSGVYLINHWLESIHIWPIGTLEGWLSFHDSWPHGPCRGVGLEVKI